MQAISCEMGPYSDAEGWRQGQCFGLDYSGDLFRFFVGGFKEKSWTIEQIGLPAVAYSRAVMLPRELVR